MKRLASHSISILVSIWTTAYTIFPTPTLLYAQIALDCVQVKLTLLIYLGGGTDFYRAHAVNEDP